jgi:Uncharacterized conserved protein (DUF2285)
MRSLGAGGYEVAGAGDVNRPGAVLWTANALPSVIALTGLPADLTDPEFRLPPIRLDSCVAADGAERLVERDGVPFRIHLAGAGTEPPAVLLPFDELFEVRATAAVRLWRSLTGRNPGPNPAVLSPPRRDRLVLALRALDGRLAGASYREIAGGLFGADRVPLDGWKTHDLRDRTIRLVRFGIGMMRSGYRRLLRHPHRRRL